MDDLDHLIIDALGRVLPSLSKEQLEIRLARRRRPMLTRPPREWCLAVRASDTRIKPPLAKMEKLWVNEMGAIASHTVVLNKELLEGLAGPVQLRPYTEHRRVAAELGTGERRLHARAKKGYFQVKYIKGLLGRRGYPVPCLYRVADMDPNARNNHPPDLIWGGMWMRGASVLPDDFEQEMRRRAAYMVVKERLVFSGFRWECPKCAKLVRTIYCPLPRPTIAYALNLFPGGLEAHPLPANEQSFACMECHGVSMSWWTSKSYWNRFITYVTDGLLYGSEVKMPAEWRKEAPRHRSYRRPKGSPNQDRVLALLMEGKCCRMIAAEMGLRKRRVYQHIHALFHRFDVKTIGGIAEKLGKELPRHRDRGRPWKRGREVMELLLQGESYAAIAERLGMSIRLVAHHAVKVYKRHGVHCVDDLARVLGRAYPVRKPRPWTRMKRVLELLIAGRRPYHIAREMGVSSWTVSRHMVSLCRKFGVGTVDELKVAGRGTFETGESDFSPLTVTPAPSRPQGVHDLSEARFGVLVRADKKVCPTGPG